MSNILQEVEFTKQNLSNQFFEYSLFFNNIFKIFKLSLIKK